MLNSIWPWFIIVSIIYSFFSGNINEINDSIFVSSKSAIDLSIVLFGNVALWCGLINIFKSTRAVKFIVKVLNPIIKYLFPESRNNEEVRALISMNIISNMLGLGNAATPIGIKAMKELDCENKEQKNMSNSMMLFILINSASIQLIPTTIFTIRKSLGSNSPTSIIMPVWISTIAAAIAGMLTLKLLLRKKK